MLARLAVGDLERAHVRVEDRDLAGVLGELEVVQLARPTQNMPFEQLFDCSK